MVYRSTAVVVLVPVLRGGKQDKHALADALVQRAAGLSKPATPVQLRGTFWLGGSRKLEGSYEFVRLSPEQQQEAFSFGDYREVRIARDSKLHIKRSLGFQPLPMYMLAHALPPALIPALAADEEITEVHRHKRHGEPVTCFDVIQQRKTSGMCFSEQTGALVERTETDLKWAYSDFVPYRGSLLPHTMKAYENDRLVVELNINLVSEPPSTVAIVDPAQALTIGWCEDPLPALIEDHKRPEYPFSARQQRRQGRVGVYAIVGADGRLYNISLARSAGSDLDNATLTALTGWRYRPASCAGKPVESETYIITSYTLSSY